MATRSRIGILLADDTVLSVYHHCDGYPEWLGVKLRKNYTIKEKISDLLNGGDISCIESDQDWNREKVNIHVKYYNERGEDTEPRLDLSLADYLNNGEEYAYLFTDENKWICYNLQDPKYIHQINIPEVNVEELISA